MKKQKQDQIVVRTSHPAIVREQRAPVNISSDDNEEWLVKADQNKWWKCTLQQDYEILFAKQEELNIEASLKIRIPKVFGPRTGFYYCLHTNPYDEGYSELVLDLPYSPVSAPIEIPYKLTEFVESEDGEREQPMWDWGWKHNNFPNTTDPAIWYLYSQYTDVIRVRLYYQSDTDAEIFMFEPPIIKVSDPNDLPFPLTFDIKDK